MKGKKLIALLLAAVLALALCACGETTIEAYDTAVPLDFESAWAKYDPDTPVLYVDGETVTWQEFFYQIKYFTELVSATEGVTVSSWSQTSTRYTDAGGSPMTYGALVLQNAVNTLVQYHAMHYNLTAVGAVLGKEALDSVEELRQNAIDDTFDGDESAFQEYLDGMYCTEELWNWYNQVDALYAYDGFDLLYGEFGSALPDEDVMTYAAGDPDGVWTEYVQIKQIYLYDPEDGEGEETDASDEAAADKAAAVVAALDAAADKEAAFDRLYAEYNENDALDVFEGGRCVYQGDVDDAVYEAALDMDNGGYAAVAVDGGTVVVMRVPIDPDAGVYYEESDGTMYTLRYYAAWQSYSDRINGENGWIASAERTWADGFGDLTLEDLFA